MELTGELAKMTTITPVVFVSIIISVSSPILAQVSSEHVISDVSRLLERGVSDKKIAREVSKLQPAYYLSEASLEELGKRRPIGPRTLFALQVLAYNSLYLDPASPDIQSADAPPDPALVERIEQSIRNQMTQSLELLPKFICKKQETLFSNCQGGFPAKTQPVCDEEWHQIEPYYFGRKSPLDNDRVPLGEFKFVLDSTLQWKRWDICGGQKCAVFSYMEKAAPYAHGLVFCSPKDGAVYRIISSLPGHGESTTKGIMEFGSLSIDNNTYRFPTKWTTMVHQEKHVHRLRGVVVVTEYHKLKADSNILYGVPK
jgi:hypothetical protein